MKIYMLWGQRKCHYTGQYAPELLTSVDEYTDEGNPGFLTTEEEKYRRNKSFESLCIIQAEIDDAVVVQALSITDTKLTEVKPIK